MSEVETGLGRIRDRRALIFWGMRDPGFPRADLERFQAAFPSHKTIELADADHFFFEDAVDQMVREIRAFVEQDAGDQEPRRTSSDERSRISLLRKARSASE